MSTTPIPCPGSVTISGNDKSICCAGTALDATTGANAMVQNDADRDAKGEATKYHCSAGTTGPCRQCHKVLGTVTVTPSPAKVTHWSLINVISRLFAALGGNHEADYTATVEFKWTAVINCDCAER